MFSLGIVNGEFRVSVLKSQRIGRLNLVSKFENLTTKFNRPIMRITEEKNPLPSLGIETRKYKYKVFPVKANSWRKKKFPTFVSY